MVDTLLSAHNLRVGRFTSPHLTRVTERIGVDGHDVHAAAFARVYDEIEPFLEMIDAALGGREATGADVLRSTHSARTCRVRGCSGRRDGARGRHGRRMGFDEHRRHARLRLHRCGTRPPGLSRRHDGGDRPHEGGDPRSLRRSLLRNRNRSPSSPTSRPTACSRCSQMRSPAGDIRAWTEGQGYGVVDRTLAVDGQMVSLRGIGVIPRTCSSRCTVRIRRTTRRLRSRWQRPSSPAASVRWQRTLWGRPSPR